MADGLNLTGVLDHLDDSAEGEELSVGDILDSLGSRGYGPLLIAVSLIELLPTGAIPGVPTLVAVLVVLLAGQLLLGRSAPWVPGRLRKLHFKHEKFETGRDKIKPWTQKIDRALKPRLPQLVSSSAERVVAVVCIVLALTMPPLELVPLASSVPSAAIGLFGLGLSARDGLLVALGLLVAIGGAVAAVLMI